MADYLLPDVGEGLTEAEIITWKVKVGDVVAINDIVVEIETAKSLVELPSPFAGAVTAILVAEGETVPVGTPIISIGEPVAGGGDTPDSSDLSAMDLSNPAASGGGEGESLVGRMRADRGAQRRPRKKVLEAAGEFSARAGVHDTFNQHATHQHEVVAQILSAVESDTERQAATAPAPAPASGASPAAAMPTSTRVLAKPPVRKLARDLGVDLASLAGSGDGGVITRDDVESAAAGSGMPERYEDLGRPGVAPMSGARETREQVKGVRKMMAGAMVGSAFTAPHVTEWITVDVTESTRLVRRLKDNRDFRDVKVSPLLVLARACLIAMRRTPIINSWWDEQAQEVVTRHYVNLGIAAATPRGLVVPNVKDAEQMSLLELATSLNELTAVAKEGRTQPADMAGGTFTITNVGVFGVDAGTPIINPGESAILCFGATNRRPWVVGEGDQERLEIRDVCTLALSFDHRHIDGEAGSRFLADVAGIMRDPGTALLF